MFPQRIYTLTHKLTHIHEGMYVTIESTHKDICIYGKGFTFRSILYSFLTKLFSQKAWFRNKVFPTLLYFLFKTHRGLRSLMDTMVWNEEIKSISIFTNNKWFISFYVLTFGSYFNYQITKQMRLFPTFYFKWLL